MSHEKDGDLTPDQIKGIAGNADVTIDGAPEATLVYLAANGAHPILGKTEVVEAIRSLIDYEGMARTLCSTRTSSLG